MKHAKISDTVELEDDDWDYNGFPEEYRKINKPVKGNKYTIRDVVVTKNGVGYRLLELWNLKITHPNGLYSEPAFRSERFKKIKK